MFCYIITGHIITDIFMLLELLVSAVTVTDVNSFLKASEQQTLKESVGGWLPRSKLVYTPHRHVQYDG